MNEREAAKAQFLRAEGWQDAQISPLAGDASNRRYERVVSANGRRHAVLMDAPAEQPDDLLKFLAFTNWLRDQRLSAPEIMGVDVGEGFALIEDLGDDLFARVAHRDPSLELAIYEKAVDLLAYLTTVEVPQIVRSADHDLPVAPYDLAVLQREALLALEWWYEAAQGQSPSPDLVAEFTELVEQVTGHLGPLRQTLVLRDYHAENLLWLPDRQGHAQVGLLDYQDALAGAAAYDLVSLLEDARRDTPEDLQQTMFDRFCQVANISSRDDFGRAYAALGAQRNLKIIGIFARLWLRDGKPGYLDLTPRVWTHLQRDLQHSALADLRAFVQRHLAAPSADVIARIKGLRR